MLTNQKETLVASSGLYGNGSPSSYYSGLTRRHENSGFRLGSAAVACDSKPDMSFDISASPGYAPGLGRVSSAKVDSHVSPSGVPRESMPHHVPPFTSLLSGDRLHIHTCH
ncbi:hypothetical protein Tco_0624066 [Tanacetum coccineum]|uniref:Uncharacterized protein n=1 Tax=Tanacetum coccineum TaxID=301880 RepID=A0ABQ4WCY2_9ASTR